MPIFIFLGSGAKVKDTNVRQNRVCRQCERYSTFSIFSVFNYFHIFGIRIFSWNQKYIAVCPHCGDTYTIPNEEYEKAKDDILYKIPIKLWLK